MSECKLERERKNESKEKSKSWKIHSVPRYTHKTLAAVDIAQIVYYKRGSAHHTLTHTEKRARGLRFPWIFFADFIFSLAAATDTPYNYTNGDRLRQHLPIFKHVPNVCLPVCAFFASYTLCVVCVCMCVCWCCFFFIILLRLILYSIVAMHSSLLTSSFICVVVCEW